LFDYNRKKNARVGKALQQQAASEQHAMMLTKTTSWLPAFTIALSAAATHLLMPIGNAKYASDMTQRYRQEDDLIASPPLLPHNNPPARIEAIPPEEGAMPDGQEAAEAVEFVDIWERMRGAFGLPEEMTESVAWHIDNFRKHSWRIERLLARGQPYLYYILNQVERRGLPAELALLPAVESAFDPFATSPAGAAGIWQFMPGTAEQVGLRQDWWYDGRRDIVAGTGAALDYLAELQQHFDGDWLLALGAYNTGIATIKKAIQYNQDKGEPTDFWHLDLPQETRDYVPKLIALRVLINNPDAYNITLPALTNSRYFRVVDIGGRIDLQVAARLAGTSLDELQRLNPGLNRSITPPDGQHRLLVPSGNATLFCDRLALLPHDQRVQSITYRIRLGDTLSAIAHYSRTTVARLRQLNRLDNSRIIAGRLLIIPTKDSDQQTGLVIQASLM
jgi:membrane-bound lytic murein transglycosylase D